MRKIWYFLVCVVMTLSISSCNPFQNDVIYPMNMSHSQKEIFDLMNDVTNQMSFFSFTASKNYANLEMWVERYEYGELKSYDTGIIVSGDIKISKEGTIGVNIIDNEEGLQFRFITTTENGKYTGLSEKYINFQDSPHMFSLLSANTNIAENEDIILCVYTIGGTLLEVEFFNQYDLYQDLIEDEPMYYIIKCKFYN